MKSVCISLFLFAFAVDSFAQYTSQAFGKPIIDSFAINHWVSLENKCSISNNGCYFMYCIDNKPFHSTTLVVKSMDGSWIKEFPGASTGFFSGDSKHFVFLLNNRLCIFLIGTDSAVYISDVSDYRQPKAGDGMYFAYRLRNAEKELVLYNLLLGAKRSFNFITNYEFNEQGNTLLLKQVSGQGDDITTSLQRFNLSDSSVTEIWSSKYPYNKNRKLVNYCMDMKGDQVAFIMREDSDLVVHNTLWYYKAGMANAVEKVRDHMIGIESGLSVSNAYLRFSEDGHYLFFKLQDYENKRLGINAVSLDVWNYRDAFMQSEQLHDLEPRTYFAVFGIGDSRVIRLTHEFENLDALPSNGNFVVVAYNNQGDRFWLNECDKNFLISLKDGSRALLRTTGKRIESWFSPDGRFLVYFDPGGRGDYFSYDLRSKVTINLTRTIPVNLNREDEFNDDPENVRLSSVGIASWEEDGTLLIYDNFDIWKVDLSGNGPPENITNNYGRIHHIRFRLMEDEQQPLAGTSESGRLILTAFNCKNKYNGFYRARFNGGADPELLTMGPWTISHRGKWLIPVMNANDLSQDMIPLKSRDADIWVVLRQSTTEAPNFFLTYDFVNYRPLTSIEPQRMYNWLTAELVSWRQFDGSVTSGVLYKPEDFDYKKKYPLIINYYQQLSQRLYEFPMPQFQETANPNIAWFVSHGYLVFTPDIIYPRYQPYKGLYNTIVSATKWLVKLQYVAADKIAIAGHSWGGGETNYLVTHTHIFAAAVQGSGASSDWINRSLTPYKSGNYQLDTYEERIGATIWERPDLWIANSPIFQVDQITSPFLILHCKDDDGWLQSVELFTAMRRLNKKVWMLQYDNGSHLVYGEDAEDFTIRMTQFFDHYLKDKPEPIWMSQGIPARSKGVEMGLQLDKIKNSDQ